MPERRAFFRRCLPLVPLLLIVSVSTAGSAPVPRLAVSLPANMQTADIARATASLGSTDLLFIVSAGTVQIGATVTDGTTTQPSALPVQRAYLHVVVRVNDVPGVGRERERLIEQQVSDILQRLALDRPGIAGLVIETAADQGPDDVLMFALATLIVRAKGAQPGLQVALALPPAVMLGEGERERRLLAYADMLVVPHAALRAEGNGDRLARAAAGRPILLVGDEASHASAASGFLDVFMTPGATIADTVWMKVQNADALAELCRCHQFLARSLGEGFEMTAPERAPVAVLVNRNPPGAAVAFVGTRTSDVAVLLRTGATPSSPLALVVTAPSSLTLRVSCYAALDGRGLPDDNRTAPPGCRADTDVVLMIARAGVRSDRLFEEVRVSGRASMRVEEIIAHWQAAREAQRQAIEHYSVPCFVSLHFESTSVDMMLDVALEMEQFVDRSGTQEWVQTAMLLNGVRLAKGREFPLPQLEPEKVVTRPLELRIDEKYEYELVGTETVKDRLCYVVEIRPGRTGESLYGGRVWIDGVTFQEVRLRLEQRDGKNNVAAHVETQEFEPIADAGGHVLTLVRSISSQDAVNLGGRTVMLEKRYRFGEYAINAPDFAERLAVVRTGDAPMFRDTDEGLRALRRKGDARVVEPTHGKRIRSLVAGVLYNGTASFPVPLAGLTWVDFDFLHKGMQLSALFAGPLFTASLSRQENKSLRWGVDLSLSALPSYYYAYNGNNELPGEQIHFFEQYIGGLINWQVTSDLVVSAQTHLYLDDYGSTSETDSNYRVPANGLKVDAYGEAKYMRHGFSGLATIEETHRLGWSPFGYDEHPGPTSATFTRYSFEASQHLFVGKLTRGGVMADYFGGRNLDRFSRYSPSFLLRPRLKGIPVGVDTFDEVTTISGYYGFNVMDVAKLEGSYGHSWTRNTEEGGAIRQFDGLDVTIGLAGPFGTFVQGNFSFAIRGNLERYTSRWGTYLLFMRPLH